MQNVLYEVSFKLHSSYYESIFFSMFILIFTLIMCLSLWKKRFELDTEHQVKCILSGMMAIGSLIFTVISVVTAARAYQQIIIAYQNSNYETVIGEVENFVPMPYTGHGYESFEINGVYFEYSDYSINQGYNNTRSHGGVITGDGQNLKIRYIEQDDDNVIVYIEEIDS